MSILKNFFGNSSEENQPSKINWIPLTDLDQLNEISVASNEKPMVIFKHSTRCSISRMALKQFENEYALTDDEVTIYFLDLLSFRDISNAIATRFQVEHQSPQLILIKEEKVIYNASHSDIDAETLKNKL
ncbi:bacillithiol system redox-active protein YtxJ [Flavobacterium sp.]|uniref:bacillithiol system redox-active protein YtxJ n=1 Tax=Flavobacterium sp. TaxID=239 RepID=UPI002B4B50FE|nr:bacillithiol system redox-active protein YtxJ [Flavobacterium sp.]HLF51795.1 bacillithiol system redox-active protein YtxJ [Flavobacterium sp.]